MLLSFWSLITSLIPVINPNSQWPGRNLHVISPPMQIISITSLGALMKQIAKKAHGLRIQKRRNNDGVSPFRVRVEIYAREFRITRVSCRMAFNSLGRRNKTRSPNMCAPRQKGERFCRVWRPSSGGTVKEFATHFGQACTSRLRNRAREELSIIRSWCIAKCKSSGEKQTTTSETNCLQIQ